MIFAPATRTILIALLILTLPACFTTKAEKYNSKKMPASIKATDSNYQEKLDELVQRSLDKLKQHDSDESAEIAFRKPYFYKQYVNYPGGTETYATDIRASESLTTPYTANIRVKKQRYVTKFRKKRKVVNDDTTYYESTGYETLSFEMRNGRWREIGSLFIAEQTDPRLKRDASKLQFEDADLLKKNKKRWWQKLLFWRD